jgi:hypothetical protein
LSIASRAVEQTLPRAFRLTTEITSDLMLKRIDLNVGSHDESEMLSEQCSVAFAEIQPGQTCDGAD